MGISIHVLINNCPHNNNNETLIDLILVYKETSCRFKEIYYLNTHTHTWCAAHTFSCWYSCVTIIATLIPSKNKNTLSPVSLQLIEILRVATFVIPDPPVFWSGLPSKQLCRRAKKQNKNKLDWKPLNKHFSDYAYCTGKLIPPRFSFAW